MNMRAIGAVIVVATLVACNVPTKPSADPGGWTYTVDGLEVKRDERVYEGLGHRSITFTGKAKLLAKSQAARESPHLVWLNIKKTDALSGSSETPQLVLVKNGVGEVEVYASYDRPLNEPGSAVKPPEFDFSILGVQTLLPGRIEKAADAR